MIPESSLLDEPFTLAPEQLDFYRTYQFIQLKSILDAATVRYFNDLVSARVLALTENSPPLEARDTYGQAFIQLTNLWQLDAAIRPLVFSRRLADIATQLMEVNGVRLYHDQALFKEAGGGITPWHADQYYWPLASDKAITAWIPLQATPLSMGPLEFSAGSHRIQQGRDLAIGAESERSIGARLRVTDFEHVIAPFDLGEVSFHSGWIFHRAGANRSTVTRKVMTIIYLDEAMRLQEPAHPAQQLDRDTWCPGVAVGEVIDSPLNPVLYRR